MRKTVTPSPEIVLSPEVIAARSAGRPVVALESTILTHGMPFPQNLEMARSVEAIIREEGATPATIAVVSGRLHAGLEDAALEGLARITDAMKLSRADLAFAIAGGANGGTTVAATMMAAALAGIGVFATGGIGGVHKGAEESFDISADLEELRRSPVIVVCAGAKAILDIPKTLEVLETNGVPVVGYGTGEMPAFWSRQSGIACPLRLDTPEAIAAFQARRRALAITDGMLVCNPVPEGDEIPMEEMAGHINAAVAEAARNGIAGKAVTPWLLARIVEMTGGRSLETNIALVKNNARLAARIAVALSQAG